MGGKSSKSELNRSKSFSTFGRSSQRSLFQKSKLALNQINKRIGKDDSVNLEDIKIQLEKIEKDLNEISPTIKEKNKQKYEDALNYFQQTKSKIENKIQTVKEASQAEKPLNGEGERQVVELKPVKVFSSTDNLNDEQGKNEDNIVSINSTEQTVEIRKPKVPTEKPTSPKIKFGVQVMPVSPRISQELLKRSTLPENETPKEEFKKIRNYSYSGGTPETSEPNVIYPNSPNSQKRYVLEALEKRELNASALKMIESIAKDVDELENKLKYFKGKKGDKDYLILHQLFVRNMVKLDNIEVKGDSVVRQERKISIERIQELIKILECLVQQENVIKEESEESDVEDEEPNTREKKEEVINLEGKPVTATKL